jgi:hypothetical protein
MIQRLRSCCVEQLLGGGCKPGCGLMYIKGKHTSESSIIPRRSISWDKTVDRPNGFHGNSMVMTSMTSETKPTGLQTEICRLQPCSCIQEKQTSACFFKKNTSADQLNSMNESFGHVLETGAIDLRPTDIETDFPQILS